MAVVAVHTLPPTRSDNARLRNRQLADAGRIAQTQTAPVIVVGDLNATEWSPPFGDLLRSANLRDARTGFGLQPTWPTFARLSLLQIPIDHCLISEGLHVKKFTRGPHVGSDHLPIVVDVLKRRQ